MAEFSRDEVLAAYRRSKSDMLQQRGLPSANEFIEFEAAFATNIERVQTLLNQQDQPYNVALGETFEVPRASSTSQTSEPSTSVDPTSPETTRNLVADLPRRMFLPSINLLILSAVWMDRVGTGMERLQSADSYGNRLRTTRAMRLHRQGPSFKSYIERYLKWRDSALHAASEAARGSHKIQVVTFDISNFYGSLRPDFLLSDSFQAALHEATQSTRGGPAELANTRLTERLAECLKRFADENPGSGLPIGLPASAVIANAALHSLDAGIKSQPGILSYGRYVDDFILVRRADQASATPAELLHGSLPPYLKEYDLKIADGKTRSFEVSSEYASVLMNELRASFAHLSSEWRSLPSDESIERLSSLVVETRTGRRVRPELRDADTLATQRWTLSALLSRFARFSANLEPKDGSESHADHAARWTSRHRGSSVSCRALSQRSLSESARSERTA